MSDPHAPAPSPTRIGGRYVLRAEIGRGGMATVHRAEDEVLGRQVAVKILHGHLAGDPAFLDRFRREARAAAALTHRNIVTVHDWGEDVDGAYLILQHVDGASLREVLRRRGRLEPAEAVTLAAAVADGLGAAHAAGLVHRDVKPENVLIDHSGQVLLTDFGLARAAASATSTFGADVLVGSPHYLSPEAVEGEAVDARSDVYALGVMLFECLTGRPPHEGESPLATALRHAAHPVPPPSTLRPDLPTALDDVVEQATSRDPAQRPVDGAELAAMLRRVAMRDGTALAGSATLVLPLDASETIVSGRGAGGLPPPPVLATEEELDAAEPAEEDDLADHEDLVDHDVEPERRRRGRRGWIVALVILGLLAASAAAGFLVWDRVLAPVLPIPTVDGMNAAAAASELEEAGFTVVIGDERPFDREVPSGHVLRQDPIGEARRGAPVVLTVSAGPRQVAVPPVTGMSRTAAVDAIEDADLVAEVTEAYHGEVPEGDVISSDPPAGIEIDEGGTVEVEVSLGRPPVEVPAVSGEPLDDALDALDEAGLRGDVIDRRHHDEVPAGVVIAQEPDAGAELRQGDTVSLVVSEGPPPVEVPNLREEQVEDAVAILESLGLEARVQEERRFRGFLTPGRVFDQDPAPGVRLRRGDEVVLYVYAR